MKIKFINVYFALMYGGLELKVLSRTKNSNGNLNTGVQNESDPHSKSYGTLMPNLTAKLYGSNL